LGRTGRAGKEGSGIQVLLPFEAKKFAKTLGNNTKAEDSTTHNKQTTKRQVDNIRQRTQRGEAQLAIPAEGAYRSFLAYYMSRTNYLGISKHDVVRYSKQFAEQAGLIKLPGIERTIAKKLGIERMKDVSIVEDNEQLTGSTRP